MSPCAAVGWISTELPKPVKVLLWMAADAPRDGYDAEAIKLTPAPGLAVLGFCSCALPSSVSEPATFCMP